MGIEALLQSQVIGLTSALAAKLDLSGGTLTGLLTGTSIRLSPSTGGGTVSISSTTGTLTGIGLRGATRLDVVVGGGGPMSFSTSSTILGSSYSFGWGSASSAHDSSSLDVALFRDAANTLAQRNGVSAQAFRLYNTYTSATSYERGKFAWESNVLQIGTEKGSAGGSARALELQTDGTTRLTISTTGNITLGTATGTRLFFANAAGAPSITDYSNAGISILGQDGTVGTLNTGNVMCRNTGYVYWSGRALMTSSANGVVHVQNFDMNESVNQVLCLGPGTSSTNGVRLKRAVGTTVIDFRNGNDTDAADITAKAATFSGNVTLSTVNLVTDTTTGTKIGTGSTQKLGFWDATPIVQPSAVADATDAASAITQLNALLSRLRSAGLIAA